METLVHILVDYPQLATYLRGIKEALAKEAFAMCRDDNWPDALMEWECTIGEETEDIPESVIEDFVYNAAANYPFL